MADRRPPREPDSALLVAFIDLARSAIAARRAAEARRATIVPVDHKGGKAA